jgi:hypothetical protein
VIKTKQELLESLPVREFWFAVEVAKAFGVTRRTIQYAASRKNIGRLVRQGPRGTYVFLDSDLDKLILHIHGTVGNPQHKARKQEKLQAIIREQTKYLSENKAA